MIILMRGRIDLPPTSTLGEQGPGGHSIEMIWGSIPTTIYMYTCLEASESKLSLNTEQLWISGGT